MNNEVLQDFTTFLGAINFDCSGNRLDHIMEGNKMVFKDASVNKMYEAYRNVLRSGYRMGRQSMLADINSMVKT
jgi:hypothetical protein